MNNNKCFQKIYTVDKNVNVYQPTEKAESWYIFVGVNFPVPLKVFYDRENNIMKIADHCNSDKITCGCSENSIEFSDVNPKDYLWFKKNDALNRFNIFLQQIPMSNNLNFSYFFKNTGGEIVISDLKKGIGFIKFLESKKFIDKKTLDDIIVFNEIPNDPLSEIKNRLLKFFVTIHKFIKE